MSPFWATLFTDLRERGRHPHIFIVALAVLLVLLLLGATLMDAIGRENFNNYVAPALGGLLLLWMAWAFIRGCMAIFRKPNRSEFRSLSSDELAKARSKLRNKTSSMRRPQSRTPDTDLKY